MVIRLLLTVLLAVGTSPFHACHCAAADHPVESPADDADPTCSTEHECHCEPSPPDPAVLASSHPVLSIADFVDIVPPSPLPHPSMSGHTAAIHPPPCRTVPLYISHLALRN